MKPVPSIHIALLGDSIFDNRAYVREGESVIENLNLELPESIDAMLLAVDGNVVIDVHAQLSRLPDDASHIVLSAGGNDALSALPAMRQRTCTVEEAMRALAPILGQFREQFRLLLHKLSALNKPFAVCTIYDAVPGLDIAHKTALGLFNDIIVREALAADAEIIDLREICTEPGDYSSQSPIEPSEAGGLKIALAIRLWLIGASERHKIARRRRKSPFIYVKSSLPPTTRREKLNPAMIFGVPEDLL